MAERWVTFEKKSRVNVTAVVQDITTAIDNGQWLERVTDDDFQREVVNVAVASVLQNTIEM